MDEHGASPTRPVMFLADENWSPRFETTFFTVKTLTAELQTELPISDCPSTMVGGKATLPAYYYKVEVLCGHARRSVLRRYSQFLWLYEQLKPPNRDGPVMPPKTCCQPQDAAFAQNRLEQLRELLPELLQLPGNSSHPAVVAFFELDSF